MRTYVAAYCEVVCPVIRVGVATAVDAGAFHEATVATPRQGPVGHVVGRGVVDGAAATHAHCRWVDACEYLPVRQGERGFAGQLVEAACYVVEAATASASVVLQPAAHEPVGCCPYPIPECEFRERHQRTRSALYQRSLVAVQ